MADVRQSVVHSTVPDEGGDDVSQWPVGIQSVMVRAVVQKK